MRSIFALVILLFAAALSPAAAAADDAARPEAVIGFFAHVQAVSTPKSAHRGRAQRALDRAARRNGFALAAAETIVRGQSTALIAVAERYIGSRRFTARARAWCADAMNAWLAKAGYSGTGDGRAISFARYGRPSAPKIGAIAVMRHHVGVVVGRSSRGIVLLSGNHGRRVGVGVYSARRILAYREPT